jgi:hypothetical protein
VEGGGGGLTVSRVSRNRGGFVNCVAIQKRLGIPDLRTVFVKIIEHVCDSKFVAFLINCHALTVN